MTDDEDILRQLYQAPLPDFVATRKSLAARLSQDGEREAARALLKRAKPKPAAWLTNQLFYAAPEAFRAAVDAAAALAEAHAGGGLSLEQLQARSSARRTTLEALVQAGMERARQGALPTTAQHQRALHDTLAAATAAPEAVPLGQLAEVLPAPSFTPGLAAAVRVEPPGPAPANAERAGPAGSPTAGPAVAQGRTAMDAERAAERARQQLAAAQEATRQAAQGAVRAANGLAAARARADGLRAQWEALQTQLTTLEQRHREAQATLLARTADKRRADAQVTTTNRALTVARAAAARPTERDPDSGHDG